jgi:hypothetical protein
VSNSRAFPAGDGVESFAFDPIRHRLALTSHHGIIKMYRFENGKAAAVESQMLVNFEHRESQRIMEGRDSRCHTLHSIFVDKGNNVMIYGLETGAA